MKLVIKIGGSLLFDEDEQFDITRYQGFANAIRQIKELGHNIVLVIGGGVLAKSLVKKGKLLGANRDTLDQLGIAATWVCAQLMIATLRDVAYPTPIMSEEQLANLQGDERLLILGGLRPGQSTNAVAAQVAELTNSKILLNVTDVEGVYDSDPKEFTQAKLLSEITIDQLRKIITPLESQPGTYPLFDNTALDIIQRAQIEVWFVNGTTPENIVQAIEKRKIGTRVVPSPV
ncbi:MAG: UMP kinase [Candidatus Hermodarchaeota archaeon]